MLGPRPSASTAPSIWYAEVAAPQAKPGGNRSISPRGATEGVVDIGRCLRGSGAGNGNQRPRVSRLPGGDRDAVAAGEPGVDGVERHAVGRGCVREQILSPRDGDVVVDPNAVLDVAQPEAHLAEPSHDQCPSMHAAPSSV